MRCNWEYDGLGGRCIYIEERCRGWQDWDDCTVSS